MYASLALLLTIGLFQCNIRMSDGYLSGRPCIYQGSIAQRNSDVVICCNFAYRDIITDVQLHLTNSTGHYSITPYIASHTYHYFYLESYYYFYLENVQSSLTGYCSATSSSGSANSSPNTSLTIREDGVEPQFVGLESAVLPHPGSQFTFTHSVDAIGKEPLTISCYQKTDQGITWEFEEYVNNPIPDTPTAPQEAYSHTVNLPDTDVQVLCYITTRGSSRGRYEAYWFSVQPKFVAITTAAPTTSTMEFTTDTTEEDCEL